MTYILLPPPPPPPPPPPTLIFKALNEIKNILTFSRLSDPIYWSPISRPPLLSYILSTYNSQHNNNINNVVLAMTMPYSGQG